MLRHVHRSGESGSPGAVGSTNASRSRRRVGEWNYTIHPVAASAT